MKLRDSRCIRFALGLVGTLTVAAGLMARPTQGGGAGRISVPHDWSHRHVVFSGPSNIWHAWKLQQEPRYWHQWLHRNAQASQSADPLGSGSHLSLPRHHHRRVTLEGGTSDEDTSDEDASDDDTSDEDASDGRTLKRDWAMSLTAGGTSGAGMFPAKFTFDVTAAPSCANDYVVFTTSLTNPSIVAFNQLYSTQGSVGGFCNQDGPSVMWSYNTNPAGDTTGTVVTSAVLSGDGTKVAYVETRTAGNGGAILHVLKWKAGQGTIGAPVAPDTTLAGGADWSTCPAGNSCLVNITFNLGQPDTNSSPFYVFAFDILYVGDDNGVLHKFTGVFNGTPAEVTTGWPITVNSGTVLSSPVVDSGSGNIFVGDGSGQLSYVREVGSTVGACGAGSPPCVGSPVQNLGGSIVDGPIVDGSTGRVLVFDGTDISNGSVYQFDNGLTAGSKVTVAIGGTAAGSNLHSGTFDDAYFSVGPASGHFYTCGKDPANNDRPAIYQLGFNSSGVLNAAAGTPLVNLTLFDGFACSPVTELKNGATDRIFFSVAGLAFPPAFGGNATGCTVGLGCVMSIVLGGAWPPAVTSAGIAASGGASGIVIDNVGGGAQESSLYYTYLSNSIGSVTCIGTTGVGCAVKVTQSALQ